MSKARPSPVWDPPNLTIHYRTRLREDPGCLEDLLTRPPPSGTISEPAYAMLADDAVTNSWGVFAADWRRSSDSEYEPAVYFIDEQLLVAVTNAHCTRYITCYHKHSLNPHPVRKPLSEVDRGNMRLAFKNWLKVATGRGKYRKVRWHPDG